MAQSTLPTRIIASDFTEFSRGWRDASRFVIWGRWWFTIILWAGGYLGCIHVRCHYRALQFVVGTRAAQRLKIMVGRLKIDSALAH
jgi:hypothetical protein